MRTMASSALFSLLMTLTPTASAAAPASSTQKAEEPPPFSPGGSFVAPGPFIHQDGATLFRAVCQGCHMPDARGAVGAGRYPALAANPKLSNATFPATRVLNGWLGMPSFAAEMSDAQVAEVVNYIRTHFDNHYTDRLSADDVKRLRPQNNNGASP